MSVENEKVKGPLCPHVERLTSLAAGGQAAENQPDLVVRVTGVEATAQAPSPQAALVPAAPRCRA